MKKRLIFTLALAVFSVVIANAQNPIIRDQFTADPSAHYFEGRVYVYPSHDIPHNGEDNDNGDEYQSFVNYWMAFIGSSYGLHDATWRSIWAFIPGMRSRFLMADIPLPRRFSA